MCIPSTRQERNASDAVVGNAATTSADVALYGSRPPTRKFPALVFIRMTNTIMNSNATLPLAFLVSNAALRVGVFCIFSTPLLLRRNSIFGTTHPNAAAPNVCLSTEAIKHMVRPSFPERNPTLAISSASTASPKRTTQPRLQPAQTHKTWHYHLFYNFTNILTHSTMLSCSLCSLSSSTLLSNAER